MKTLEIKSLCDRLEKAEVALAMAVQARNYLKLEGHQQQVTIRVGEHTIPVTYIDRDTGYAAKCIRGKEMILLGAQKAAEANVDAWKAECHSLKEQIRELCK